MTVAQDNEGGIIVRHGTLRHKDSGSVLIGMIREWEGGLGTTYEVKVDEAFQTSNMVGAENGWTVEYDPTPIVLPTVSYAIITLVYPMGDDESRTLVYLLRKRTWVRVGAPESYEPEAMQEHVERLVSAGWGYVVAYKGH